MGNAVIMVVQKCLFRSFIFKENSRVSTLSAPWLLKKSSLILVTEGVLLSFPAAF